MRMAQCMARLERPRQSLAKALNAFLMLNNVNEPEEQAAFNFLGRLVWLVSDQWRNWLKEFVPDEK